MIIRTNALLLAVAAALPALGLGVRPASADTKYWDPNGILAGAGTAPLGVWDTGTTANWNLAADGTGPPTTWVSGDSAVFAAGSDATGAYTVTVNGAQVAASVLVKDGAFTFGVTNTAATTDTIDTGTGTFTIGTGAGSAARVNVGSSGRLLGTGKVVLDGGTFFSTVGSGTSFVIPSSRGVEVTAAGGTIGTDDGTTASIPNLYSGTLTGTGGTTTAGVGTLTKTGLDEFRYQGAGVANTSFQKLVVLQGLYRVGAASTSTDVTVAENAFGADPTSLLTDGITLNGGAIGASLNVTLNANRGITIGANGGTFEGGGGGAVVVPSPVTSNGGALTVQGRNLTTTSTGYGNSSGSVTLSSASNATTFQNAAVVVNSSTLTLNENLTAANLSGTSQSVTGGNPVTSATTVGTITVATGKVFTFGNDNTSTSYAGRINGAGGVTKVGTGTLTMNTVNATSTTTTTTTVFFGEWANTGPVNITQGTLKFGTSSAGFSTSSTLTIAGTGTFDMNGVNDSFGSLAGSGAVINAANITIGSATNTANTAFSGTIAGAGTFTKAGTGTFTQAGTDSRTGATTVSAGTFLLNNTTGQALPATSGLTITAATVLLGTGNQINNAAALTTTGGTFNTAGFSETVGVLTVGAGTATLDLGNGSSVLAFANSSGATWTGTALNVYNWTGNATAGGGVDQLRFGSDSTGLTSGQLGLVRFYSDAGTTLLGTGQILGTGEVVPVPEPAVLSVLGLSAAGLLLRRRR